MSAAPETETTSRQIVFGVVSRLGLEEINDEGGRKSNVSVFECWSSADYANAMLSSLLCATFFVQYALLCHPSRCTAAGQFRVSALSQTMGIAAKYPSLQNSSTAAASHPHRHHRKS